MKKILSLLKTCMSNNMSLFKVKNKNNSKTYKHILPIILFVFVFFAIYYYADIIIKPLIKINVGYIILSLIAIITFFLTLVEGIYKSSSLLFNCTDDNLLLSLPIKRHTVLFIRIFKFYVFELLYNAMFLLPVIVSYAVNVKVGYEYYITSLFMILLLPIIPIFISCVIGVFISFVSTRFKLKNIAQIFITTIFLLVMLYLSYNLESIAKNIASNATSINDFITKMYYPAGVYSKLVTNFNLSDLLVFIIINILLFIILILLFSKVYFKINSKVKEIKVNKHSKNYIVRANSQFLSLVKKELKRFTNTPVFVINAAFGLVLFLIVCVFIVIKSDTFLNFINQYGLSLKKNIITEYIPVILFALISFSSLMTSITSSMISLEGKSFNILKSLPIKPFKIIFSKVIAALIIMIPVILIGDSIMFIKFKFNFFSIIMIISLSIIIPLVSELIGIIVNLKYPKMNAESDTEVVKQSISSFISVLIGIVLIGINIFVIIKCIEYSISNYIILFGGIIAYMIILISLLIYLYRRGIKYFYNISV